MPDDSKVIDLTFSSDDEGAVEQSRKRQRAPAPSDSDIIEIEEPDDNAADVDNQDVELGEDGLAIVADRVEAGNTDYPHTRDNCGVHKYTFGKATSNAQTCPQCFCYVCDVRVAECTQWGTGRYHTDHCNAHPKLTWARHARSAAAQHRRRSMNAATAAGPSAPAPAPAGAGAGRASEPDPMEEGFDEVDELGDIDSTELPDDDDEEEEAARIAEIAELPLALFTASRAASQRIKLVPRKQKTPKDNKKDKKKVKKCTFVARPNPASLPNMEVIARLSLPVKVRPNESDPDRSIPNIANRLEPCGFYHVPAHVPKNAKKLSYGDRFSLNNLFDTTYEHTVDGCVMQDALLECIQLPIPDPPVLESSTRVRPVIVHRTDGSAPPTKYGITVKAKCTLKELTTATAAALDLAANEELVPFVRSTSTNSGGVIDDNRVRTLDDSSQYFSPTAQEHIAFFRVKKVASPPKQGLPKYAFIRHTTHASRYSYRSLAPFVLVPLEASSFKSSNSAKNLTAAVAQAMMPFRKNVLPASAATVLNGAGFGDVTDISDAAALGRIKNCVSGISVGHNYYDWTENQSQLSGALSQDLALKHVSKKKGGLLMLTAVWKEVVHEFCLDFEHSNEIETHPSAESAAAKATIDFLTAVDVHKRLVIEAKSIPADAVRQVVNQSKECAPGTPPLPPGSSRYAEHLPLPSVRYHAQLIPNSSDPKEQQGTLNLRIYVFSSGGGGGSLTAGHRALIQSAEDWSPDSTGGGRRRNVSSDAKFPLDQVMRVVLWTDPGFVQMTKRLKEAQARSSKLDSRRPGTLLEALESGERATVAQPPGLTVTMRPYQLQSLSFLLDAESGEGGFRNLMWLRTHTPSGRELWYSPILKKASWNVPKLPWGGFLCEEMGLGKTVITLALVLANQAPRALPPTVTAQVNGKATALLTSRATLVVCAVSLVGQWAEEARTKTRGSLKIYEYHGQGRIKDPRKLAEYDLVITTYATLQSDHSSRSKNSTTSPLHAIKWHRLVLDESHTVKNPNVGHTKACVALQADRRWCCTGTPISTEISDLFGQFLTLGLAPFNNKQFFDSRVKHCMNNNNIYSSNSSSNELIYALGHVMVRHTKRQVLGGEEVLQLPPKTEELVPVGLTAEEQAAYKLAHDRSAGFFQRFSDAGPHTVSRNLLQIMSLISPMRRICSGGPLKRDDIQAAEPCWDHVSAHAAAAAAAAHTHHYGAVSAQQAAAAGATMTKDFSLVAPADEECPVCMDAYEEPVMTSCKHWFCKECILGALSQVNARCPLCRNSQLPAQLRAGVTAAEAAEAAGQAPSQEDEEEAAANAFVVPEGGVLCESKLHALLLKLREMRRADPSAKALVFSQYNSTIEWLKAALTREGFGHRHISGSMPMKQRAKAVAAFQNDPPTTVFLLSMRSGAVGINLTAASHVFLLEPALNPALEEQAIGRAWRMGQQREVKVLRFYVKGSVEERIMEVVRQRQGLSAPVDAAAGTNGGAAAAGTSAAHAATAAGLSALQQELEEELYGRGRGGGGRGHNRNNVRVEDVAGSIKADKQNLRLSELQVLFKAPALGAPRVHEPLPQMDEEEEELIRIQFQQQQQQQHQRQTAVRLPRAAARVEQGAYNENEGDAGDGDANNANNANNDRDYDPLTDIADGDLAATSGGGGGVLPRPGSGSGVGGKTRMRRSKAGIAAITGAGVVTPAAMRMSTALDAPMLPLSGGRQHQREQQGDDGDAQPMEVDDSEGEQQEQQQQQLEQQGDDPVVGAQGRLRLIDHLKKASAKIRGRLTPALSGRSGGAGGSGSGASRLAASSADEAATDADAAAAAAAAGGGGGGGGAQPAAIPIVRVVAGSGHTRRSGAGGIARAAGRRSGSKRNYAAMDSGDSGENGDGGGGGGGINVAAE